MSLDYEKALESQVDRQLKRLPQLTAPPTLALRLNAAIQTAALPWHKQSWQFWPMPVQAVSFVFLAAAFTALSFGSWKLSHTEGFAAIMKYPLHWLSNVGTFGHTINVVAGGLVLAIRNLGSGVLIAVLAVFAVGYFMCVGLGTVYLRLALARR
jgi:hypothetical protein